MGERIVWFTNSVSCFHVAAPPPRLSSAPAPAAASIQAPGSSSEPATRASPSAYTPVVAHYPARCWRSGGWLSGPGDDAWAWLLSVVEFATSFSRCSARSPYAVGVRCTGSPLFHTERAPELTRSARSVSSLPLYIYYSLPTTADHKLTECNKQRQTISTLPTISGMLFAYILLFTFSLLYHFCCSLVVCCLLMIYC